MKLDDIRLGLADQGWHDPSESDLVAVAETMKLAGYYDPEDSHDCYIFAYGYEFHGSESECVDWIDGIIMGQEEVFRDITGTDNGAEVFNKYLGCPSVDTSHLYEIYQSADTPGIYFIHSVV